MEISNFIVFIKETTDYIVLYYASGKREFYLNDEESQNIIVSLITKQNAYLNDYSSKIAEECENLYTKKSINIFLSIITILASIIAIEQSFLFSALMLIISLLNANLYSLRSKTYHHIFTIKKIYLKLEHFFFYQGIYESIDFNNSAIYKGMNSQIKSLILKNLNPDGKLDLISAFNLPYELLLDIEQNYYDILKCSPVYITKN